MAFYVDSDVLIYLLKGNPDAVGRVRGAEETDGPMVIPSLVLYEVLCGSAEESQKLLQFAEKAAIMHFGKEAAEIAAHLFRLLRSKGSEVPKIDIAIAATALANSGEKKALLLTNNKKHFERIPGLKLL